MTTCCLGCRVQNATLIEVVSRALQPKSTMMHDLRECAYHTVPCWTFRGRNGLRFFLVVSSDASETTAVTGGEFERECCTVYTRVEYLMKYPTNREELRNDPGVCAERTSIAMMIHCRVWTGYISISRRQDNESAIILVYSIASLRYLRALECSQDH